MVRLIVCLAVLFSGYLAPLAGTSGDELRDEECGFGSTGVLFEWDALDEAQWGDQGVNTGARLYRVWSVSPAGETLVLLQTVPGWSVTARVPLHDGRDADATCVQAINGAGMTGPCSNAARYWPCWCFLMTGCKSGMPPKPGSNPWCSPISDRESCDL